MSVAGASLLINKFYKLRVNVSADYELIERSDSSPLLIRVGQTE